MRIERLGYYSSEEVRDFLTPGGAADLSDTYVTDSTFAENVDDRVAALLQAGSNILLTYDDPSNTLRIGVTFTASDRILGRVTAGAGAAEELTGTQATALLDLATGALKGLLSPADKTKLDGVATGATANATDAQLRDRATHTGTQDASTLTGTIALPVANAGAITSSSPTAGMGYATGAGGSVTQITSKTTTVTLNTMCGQITTAADALAAGAVATFAVNNSGVDGDDTIVLNIGQGGATGQNYRCWIAGVDAGVFYITLENRSAGSLSEAVRFNFTVIKGITV